MAASKPTSWLSGRSNFLDTELEFRDLSWWSGLFPSRQWSLSPTVSLPRHRWNGIRSLIGFGRLTPPSPSRALPPSTFYPRLHLNAFRGEPAISEFDWHFTSTHSSSQVFAATTSSGLHSDIIGASPWPWVAHPVSGLLHGTRRPIRTRFRFGSGTTVP